jgi:hypothetical protein
MSASTAVAVTLASITPTWSHALRFWWAWQWRTLVFVLALSLLLIPTNMFLALVFPQPLTEFIGRLLGIAIAVLVSVYVMKDILDKEFRTFRVCLFPKDADTRAIQPAA